ncbi:MAG TPA: DUF222 domain-containing protein, partial [Actinomycetes bacterium]|nr:DUF222 domain-containing protein [Actinomycetes bacterium]
MFEGGGPDAKVVDRWRGSLGGVARDLSDVARIDLIRSLEELKAAAAAAQARLAADLDESVRARHREQELPPSQQGAGVASQVALARRDSPVKGGQHLGLAKALVGEMPHTLAALSEGRLSEWRATLLVRETACLSGEHRSRVDAELVADPARLDGLGDRRVAAEARRLAYRLDPAAAVARARKAEGDRAVTVRPAPDTMTYLTGLLPVRAGIAAYAALGRAADEARAVGDPRSRGQVMADTLVARVTGQAVATGAPVAVGLVMTDRALFAGDSEPAVVPGYGPVPAPVARDWLRPARTPTTDSAGEPAPRSAEVDVEVWLRRLFTHPTTGQLVAMESKAVTFPPALRQLLVLRDEVCRTPWCDALVRHADHVVPRARGGSTDEANGQGLCEQCNYVKESPGWSAGPAPGSSLGRHLVETVAPT